MEDDQAMPLAPPLPQPCMKKNLPELFWDSDDEEEEQQQPDTAPFPATLKISLPPPHDNPSAEAEYREIIDSSDEEDEDGDSSSDSGSDDDSSSGSASSDEYTSCSSSDEEDDDGPRRKKARRTVKTKKKTGMRKGVPTMVELEEAEKVHPEWEGLEAFAVFLQQGLASETATAAAAAAAEGEEKGEEPDITTTAVITTPIAIATAAAVETLSHHMRPQEMLMPFKETQREAIKAKAATIVPKVPKPPREERKPLPYKKIRRMVFHESMKGKEHIFKDGDHESACQCISVQEAKQQQQQHHQQQDSEAGVICGDEGCLNRSLQVECTQATCRFAAAGECQNQRMLKREGKAFRVFKTEDGRGWGVQAGEDIHPGQFLMEYVGEVISDEEVERRMWQAKQEEGASGGGASCFYMVDLMGATVDAKFQGNEARFVNHSCAPNCQLQKWVVNGEYRLGLFSIQPIKAGEEVHWDYQFASYGEPVMCRCGAANCRKILAGKAQEEDNKDGKGGAGGAAGGAPVSQRVEKMQRAVAEAEAFRSLMKEKPSGDMNAMVLYFNGRTSKEEMVQARRSRLFITHDGPRPPAPAAAAAAAAAAGMATSITTTSTTTSSSSSSSVATIRPLPSPVLQARLEALLKEDAAKEKKEEEEKEKEKDKENQMIQQQQAATTKKPTTNKKKTAAAAASTQKEDQATYQKHAQAQLLRELQEIATQRGPLPASTSLGRYQRKGLLTLREKRYHEVMTLPFAKKLVGEERVNAWHESRWQSLSDMVVYMRQSQITGLWTDFNEDICFNCGCSGDLICCDACSSAYHVSCAGLYEIPEEEQWFCVRCRRKAAASTQHGSKDGGGSTRRRAATGATATRGMA